MVVLRPVRLPDCWRCRPLCPRQFCPQGAHDSAPMSPLPLHQNSSSLSHTTLLNCFVSSHLRRRWLKPQRRKLMKNGGNTWGTRWSELHTFLCLFILFQHVLISETYQLQNVLQKEFFHFKQSSFDCGGTKEEEKIFTTNKAYVNVPE